MGKIVCTSNYLHMRNEEIYPDSDTFNGHRFVPGNSTNPPKIDKLPAHLALTEVSDRFLNWGYGSLAW